MSPPRYVLEALAVASHQPGFLSPEAILIDFDVEGKETRQRHAKQLLGHDTTISRDGRDLLGAALRVGIAPVLVRLGPYKPGGTDRQIQNLLERGVEGFILSMVEDESTIEAVRAVLPAEIPLGAMIETSGAVRRISRFPSAGLDFAFVGLVDLAIQRESSTIFAPLIDGTLAAIRDGLSAIPFGFGAATVVKGGHPIPNRLLLAEMLLCGASFTLLRSAFYRDIGNRHPYPEIRDIRNLLDHLESRTADEIETDSKDLRSLIESIAGA